MHRELGSTANYPKSQYSQSEKSSNGKVGDMTPKSLEIISRNLFVNKKTENIRISSNHVDVVIENEYF